MRKLFSILLVFILSFIPVLAYAAQVPLAAKNRNVYVPDEIEAELVSYNIFFRIRTGYSSANTSMVIKNPNSDTAISLKMGMPTQFDSVSKIRDLTVVSDGKKLKVVQRSTLKNPPTEKEIDIRNWYVWDINLEPGESKVIETSFSFDNKLQLDGTETISYPLDLLDNWDVSIKNLQIIADLDFYAPYSFDPMPSIAPVQYDNGGRLTFRMENTRTFPANFDLSFKPIDNIITKYIDEMADSNKEIKSILDSYKNRSYYNTIELIHDYLASSNDTEMMLELKYLEALCYENLYELDKALNLYNQLEPNPGFGESLSPTIKNKIIYDKTAILKTQPDGNEKALEYLNSVKDSVTENSIFAMWLNQEITQLTPPPVEEPSEVESEILEQNIEEEPEDDRINIIDKVTIGNYEIYIEELLVAVVFLIILILIISGIIKRRRRRRRSSIFRY